jgi:hypothetical protein
MLMIRIRRDLKPARMEENVTPSFGKEEVLEPIMEPMEPLPLSSVPIQMNEPVIPSGNEPSILPPSPGRVDIDEKAGRVRDWFISNPKGSVESARKELGMTWTTVRDIKAHLIKTGWLPASSSSL